MHKNLNAYHRINGVPNHASIHVDHDRELLCVVIHFPVMFYDRLILYYHVFRPVE
jgi:hypothetical protein